MSQQKLAEKCILMSCNCLFSPSKKVNGYKIFWQNKNKKKIQWKGNLNEEYKIEKLKRQSD